MAKLKFLFKREVITRGSNFTVRSPKVTVTRVILLFTILLVGVQLEMLNKKRALRRFKFLLGIKIEKIF